MIEVQDEDGDDAPKQTVDSPFAANQTQVATLLHIVNCLQPYLLITQREVDLAMHKDLDGGMLTSAAVTFMKTCERLDKILGDEARWGLDNARQVTDAILKTQAAALEQATAATAAAKMADNESRASFLPHRTFQPEFTRSGEMFVAYYGDVNDPDSLIMGSGKSPQDAVRAFDENFLRTVKEQPQLLIKLEQQQKDQ